MGKAIILVGLLVAACDSRVEDAVTLAYAPEVHLDVMPTYPIREMIPKLVDGLSGRNGLERMKDQETISRGIEFDWTMTLVDEDHVVAR